MLQETSLSLPALTLLPLTISVLASQTRPSPITASCKPIVLVGTSLIRARRSRISSHPTSSGRPSQQKLSAKLKILPHPKRSSSSSCESKTSVSMKGRNSLRGRGRGTKVGRTHIRKLIAMSLDLSTWRVRSQCGFEWRISSTRILSN